MFIVKQKTIIKAKREAAHNRALQAFENIKIDDVLHCKIIKALAQGFLLVTDNSAKGILEFGEIPVNKRCKIGDALDIMVYGLDAKRGIFSGSITRLIEGKQKEVIEFVSNSVIPNETILVGKVVFIERTLITIKIVYNGNIIYGYIKGDDLAWGRVLNAADIVFLGEEVKVKYLGTEEGKLYFDLKWQQMSLYPESSFDATIDELLETQSIVTNLFYGKAIITTITENENEEKDIVSAYATDLIAEDSEGRAGVLIDPFTGTQVNALIPKRYAYALENGKYYRFILTLADKLKRVEQHRLYMCIAEPYNSNAANNPYKLLVEQSFKENKSPKSNREAASYLKEIGADMYTGRDRMFYELLQNADDSASQKGVRMMIQIKRQLSHFNS